MRFSKSKILQQVAQVIEPDSCIGRSTQYSLHESIQHRKRAARELLLFGIDVIVVAPGSVATAIWSKAEAEDFTPYANTPYGPALRRLREAMLKLGRKGLKPEVLGAGIHRALTDAPPKTRYTITPDPVQDFLASHLPARWVDRLMAGQLGLRAEAV